MDINTNNETIPDDLSNWFLARPKWLQTAATRLAIKRKMRCRSGVATPTETFGCFNSFPNMNDGVINPVTLHTNSAQE